jgi:hypothetical protein
MSLLRLLTAGKSLVGLKKAEGRYHLPGDKSLPRFGSKKNPFRATVFPEKAESGTPEECPPGPADAASPRDSQAQVCQPVSVEKHDAAEHRLNCCGPASQPEIAQAGASPARRGLKAFLLWRRASKPRSSHLWGGRPLVQGELSLDSVKVVRNDLSECDLEVVPSREKPAAKVVRHANAQSDNHPQAAGMDESLACEPAVSAAEM